MIRLLTLISLLILMPISAQARCTTIDCWQMQIFGYWEPSATADNDISVNQRYPMRCGAMRDLHNIGATILDGTINMEIWECDTDTATKDLIDADPDFMILSGDQMQDTSSCSDTVSANEPDCAAASYCSGPNGDASNKCTGENEYWDVDLDLCIGPLLHDEPTCETTENASWIAYYWTESQEWVETLRPRSEPITSPEFSAVRNFMVRQGFDEAGSDACIGQNADGRTRQEILDQFLVCLGAL